VARPAGIQRGDGGAADNDDHARTREDAGGPGGTYGGAPFEHSPASQYPPSAEIFPSGNPAVNMGKLGNLRSL
jgi:hypothetical protein